MAITVPRVDPPVAEVQTGPSPVPTRDSPEVRQGRTQHLADILGAMRTLPLDERMRMQLQLLAYPEAFDKEKWDHGTPAPTE